MCPQAQNGTISSPFFYFNCLICYSWVPGALHFNVQQSKSTSILSKFSKVLASEIIVANSHFNQLILHHCTQSQLDSPKRGKANHCNNYLIAAIIAKISLFIKMIKKVIMAFSSVIYLCMAGKNNIFFKKKWKEIFIYLNRRFSTSLEMSTELARSKSTG